MKHLVCLSLLFTSLYATAVAPRDPNQPDLPSADDQRDRSGGSYFSEAERGSIQMDEANSSRGQYDYLAFNDFEEGDDCGRAFVDEFRP